MMFAESSPRPQNGRIFPCPYISHNYQLHCYSVVCFMRCNSTTTIYCTFIHQRGTPNNNSITDYECSNYINVRAVARRTSRLTSKREKDSSSSAVPLTDTCAICRGSWRFLSTDLAWTNGSMALSQCAENFDLLSHYFSVPDFALSSRDSVVSQ